MELLHFWLRKRLAMLSRYIGAYIATLPFGLLYLVLAYAGVPDRIAMIVVALPGLVVAYYVWSLIGKKYCVTPEVSVRSSVPSIANTATQYALSNQLVFTGAIAVAVFVVGVTSSRATYPSTAPLTIGSSDTQAV